MSERSVEQVREEIAAERQRLDDDLVRLRSELRSLALFTVGGLVVVGLVTWRMGKRKGTEAIWKIVK